MCAHDSVHIFGRTDAVGDAIREERCAKCGRTLNIIEEVA